IDNARAVDLLHHLLDDRSDPERDRLGMSLAGMDLMRAIQSLRVSAKGGDLSVLWQDLQVSQAALKQLHRQGADIRDTAADEGEVSRTGTDLIRQLEEALRGLGRGQPGT